MTRPPGRRGGSGRSPRRSQGRGRGHPKPGYELAVPHANVRAIIALLIVAISLLPTVLVWVR